MVPYEMKYDKQAKLYLWLTFIFGGLRVVLEANRFEISYFIGSGIGVIMFSVVIAIIIHWVLKKSNFYKYSQPNFGHALDEEIETEELRKKRIAIIDYVYRF